MENDSPNRLCLMRHLKAEIRHDMAETLATLHPDCLFEDRPIGLYLRGREGARRHYQLWWSAFEVGLDASTLHWVSDDVAIGESEYVGRHVGDFLGLAPTGREIRMPFTVVCNFKDGLLAGERFTYDLNGLLRQLGAPCFTPALAA